VDELGSLASSRETLRVDSITHPYVTSSASFGTFSYVHIRCIRGHIILILSVTKYFGTYNDSFSYNQNYFFMNKVTEIQLLFFVTFASAGSLSQRLRCRISITQHERLHGHRHQPRFRFQGDAPTATVYKCYCSAAAQQSGRLLCHSPWGSASPSNTIRGLRRGLPPCQVAYLDPTTSLATTNMAHGPKIGGGLCPFLGS